MISIDEAIDIAKREYAKECSYATLEYIEAYFDSLDYYGIFNEYFLFANQRNGFNDELCVNRKNGKFYVDQDIAYVLPIRESMDELHAKTKWIPLQLKEERGA